MRLRIADLSVHLGGHEILTGIDLEVAPGEVVGLVGPNGSGKSTLLRSAYRVLRPSHGTVELDGVDLWSLSARRSAQRIGVVVQEAVPELDLTVWEVVILGRTPHQGLLDRDTAADHRLVDDALTRVGLGDFGDRRFPSLSGGERQRVLVARALVQQATLLVLDEPTNHLDVHFQLAIMELVRGLGLSTLTALHDLNLAATYCDRIYVLAEGRVVAAGTPDDVLQPDLVHEVFGVRAERLRHPVDGRLLLAFSPGDDTDPG